MLSYRNASAHPQGLFYVFLHATSPQPSHDDWSASLKIFSIRHFTEQKCADLRSKYIHSVYLVNAKTCKSLSKLVVRNIMFIAYLITSIFYKLAYLMYSIHLTF